MRKLCCLVLIALCSPTLAALAAGPALPVSVRTSQGIKYYNGGAGLDERSRMPQLFPLKLVFATDRGHYLSDVEVKITAAGGQEVFRVRADNGPWLVADLPPDTYTIEATQAGSIKRVTPVTLGAESRSVIMLHWKTTEVDMGL